MSPEVRPRRQSPARAATSTATSAAIRPGVAAGSVVPAAAQSLGSLTQLQPAVAVVPLPVAADQDLSSIPVVSSINCSELVGLHDQQEPVDHCMDTTRLVSELAAALKELEADVISLRHENRSLRETMSQAIPMLGGGNDGGVLRPPGQSSMADPAEQLSGPLPPQRAAAVATSSSPAPPMRPAPQAAAAAQVVASAQAQTAAFRYASPRQSLSPATARLQVAPVFDGRVAIANAGRGAVMAGVQAQEPQHTTMCRGIRAAGQYRHSFTSSSFGSTAPQVDIAPGRPPPPAWRFGRSTWPPPQGAMQSGTVVQHLARTPSHGQGSIFCAQQQTAGATRLAVPAQLGDAPPIDSPLNTDRATELSPTVESTTTIPDGLHEERMEDELGRSPSPRQQDPGLEWSHPDRQQAQQMEQQPGSANVQAVSQACELPQWDVQQSVWIGKEGDEDRFLGKAQMLVLPKDAMFVSVDQAVDSLNGGVLRCPQDFCIAYSASDRGYFLLHRRGHREQAEELSRLCLHNGQVPCEAQQLAASATEAAQSDCMPVAHLLGPACMPPHPLQTLPNSSPVLLEKTEPPQLAAGVACQVPIVQAPIRHALPGQQSLTVHQVLPVQQAQLVQQTLPAEQQALPAGAGVPVVASEATIYAGVRDAPVEPVEKALHVGGEESAVGEPQCAAWQAEELLWQSLRNGHQPSQADVDAVIQALQEEGESTRAEEWLWYALECGVTPSEESFGSVIVAACHQGATEKVEDAMMQMLHLRMRPSMQMFSVVISMFTQLRDAPKVEEWLLNAGQSGLTPEQWAFEAAVTLYAEKACLKAEEWLMRARQTEYRLPHSCYDAVVQSFTRAGNTTKANEWLSRMGVEQPPVVAAALTPELAMATAAPQPQQQPVDASASVGAADTGDGGVPPPSAQQQREQKPETMAASAAGVVPGVAGIGRGGGSAEADLREPPRRRVGATAVRR